MSQRSERGTDTAEPLGPDGSQGLGFRVRWGAFLLPHQPPQHSVELGEHAVPLSLGEAAAGGFQGGKSCGGQRHCTPVRSMCRIAFRISRSWVSVPLVQRWRAVHGRPFPA